MSTGPIPTYAELPRLGNGLHAAWGIFGREDDLGTANFLTPEAVTAAAREIQTGRRINVSLPLTQPFPTFFGRAPLRHTIFDMNPSVQDDVLDNFYLQASSQWDGLRHRRDLELGFYNGVSVEEAGPEGVRLGVDAWAQGGIIGRGVLVDVARSWAACEYDPTARISIGRDALEATLAAQGQELHHGDVLLVRTGYMGAYLEASESRRIEIRDLGTSAGLAPDEDVAEFLWDHRIAAVAVDNPGVEVLPRDSSVPFLHARLIPMLGFVMGEFFDFEELSAVCAADGRYTSFFTSVPLNLPRAVGSPANAVAIR